MLRTYSAVITDASCFILLDKIDSLPLLQTLFKTVTTSVEVAQEFGKPLPDWVQIKAVQDKNFQSALFLQVDAGEASAIALAAENQPSLLIIDDLKGRKLAQKLNLTITGTLGLLLTAKKEGLIPRIEPIFDKIQSTNFRIAPSLLESILKQAGE
jgi:predicted nucleic acid-binding protein